jgi:preprotein translocase subunit YajC
VEFACVYLFRFCPDCARAAAAGGDMQSSLMSMLPLVLMFVVLYFVMIRPR